jgi:putative tricarboxylic transport membrane protein
MVVEHPKHESQAGVRTRTVEIVVAALLFLLGLIVVRDTYRIGIGWGAEGPQAGYFPFYVGAILCLAAAWVLVQAILADAANAQARFVSTGQLKHVLAVFVPSAVFVAAIYLVGIYLAAALYIGAVMRWQGRYRMLTVVAVSVGVPLFLFFMFEIWFLVPLPKGPIESWFGY